MRLRVPFTIAAVSLFFAAWSCGGDGTGGTPSADGGADSTTIADAPPPSEASLDGTPTTDTGGGQDAAPADGGAEASTDAAVGTLGPCLVDASILYLNGDQADFIHPGTLVLPNGTYTLTFSPAVAPDTVKIYAEPADANVLEAWNLEFSTAKLGAPLAPGVYRDAQRAAFAAAGHPGLDVNGEARGCNTLTGAFQIEQLPLDGGALTVSFEQHCEGADAALRGCVRVSP